MTSEPDSPAHRPSDPAAYDRAGASRILAELCRGGVFTATSPAPRTIHYRSRRMTPEPGSHLTESQRRYLEWFMKPCPAAAVTSATHRLTWTDSDGVPNLGHVARGDFGPIVPIAARETTLTLWDQLADHRRLDAAIRTLDDDQRATLAATTTDVDPIKILRVAVEATGRVLVQHAWLADRTPYRTPAEFADGLRRSGIFAAVAGNWFWELQASTFRRGMIPVTLLAQDDDTVRYPPETMRLLRLMKEQAIAEAQETVRWAVEEEGLDFAAAVHRYADELDQIIRQYALLPDGEQPRCLGQMVHTIDGRRFSVLPALVDAYVDTFIAALDRITVVETADQAPAEAADDRADQVFHVPDMSCAHCEATIRGVLGEMGIEILAFSLERKEIAAEFRSPRNRDRAFAALRDAGYSVVHPWV